MGTGTPVRKTKQFLRRLFSPASRGSRPSSSACSQRESSLFEKLPVDVIHHIHSLLPVRDAARAACVSRVFLGFWRCCSNLTLSSETLGFTSKKYGDAEIFPISIVDRILDKHSRNGLEIFRLDLEYVENMKASILDRWLKIAVRSGIKELTLVVPCRMCKQYNFPFSVLSDETAASSIQSLDLDGCTVRPTAALGILRRLKRLRLKHVDITDEALEHLLSRSPALEQIDILHCSNIFCLRIPSTLQKLTFLLVGLCCWVQSVHINAPKLSSFHYYGTTAKEISVVAPWKLKDVYLASYPSSTLSFSYARLLAGARNVERLALFSLGDQNFNTPLLISKFPCLKKLEIRIERPEPALSFPCLKKLEIRIERPEPALSFDVLSLVSFLDASPNLDSFIMHVRKDALRLDDSDVGSDNANCLRWKPQSRHDRLRQVMIKDFCSNKNLIQFVIYLVESSPLLECLTLVTTPSYPRKCGIIGKNERCSWLSESSIAEAHRAVKAANRYIAERVPPGVRFQVVEPCSRCHVR